MTSIRNIDEVLPKIDGRKDFIHVQKDGYSVVDYVYAEKDSFDCPVRLECRGLKFDSKTGDLIARPFEKFFNVGEKEQVNEIDFSKPHCVMEKLDGSMIHPAIVNNEVLYMTRMGHTDVAQACQSRHFLPGVADLLKSGFTPIFEWTAPENRIVVRYNESRLTLLAVRHMETGFYVDNGKLADMARGLGVPMARLFEPVSNPTEFMNHARGLMDDEGFVIRFHDGKAYKIKADDYVMQHRAKSDLDSEKKVLAVVLEGREDDLSAALDTSDADELMEYAFAVNLRIQQLCEDVVMCVVRNEHLDRKSFALGPVAAYDARLKGALFAVRDGRNVRECVIEAVRKNPDILGVSWRGS